MKKKQKPDSKQQNLDILATIRGFRNYIGSDKRRLILACVITVFNVAVYICSTLVLQPIINDYIEPGQLQGLIYAVGLFMLIGLADIITMFVILRLFIKVGQNVSFRMRADLFDKMQTLPLRFFDTRSQGELMSHYTNDMEQVSMAFEQSLNQLLASILTFVFIIIAMFVMNWRLALVSCVSLAVTFFFSGRITSQSKKSFIYQQRDIGKLNGYINELYSGEKVVKAFNYEDRAEEHFDALNETYRKSSSRAQIFSGLIWPVAANLNNLNYAAVVITGTILILNPASTFTIGGLIAFLIFVRMLTRPLQQVGQQLSTIFNALAGASRVFAVIAEEPEVDDGQITLEKDTHQKNTWNWVVPETPKKMVPLRGEVDFHNVTFSYDGKHPVLKDVSLYAKAGQKIAFVGSTGAGKTTITNLINRFYDVQEGSITYDGIDVKDIKKDDLRHSLGIVLQDTNLFTGTIADNIRYGNLDANEEAVVAAAQRAGAHGFIERLPDGYQTVITANGSSLSQGQRQLLAIARAAVADPPVLILDEATSSVDTRTEKMIERGMDALMENRTVFVIAHRLSTVRNADAIMVLDHGQIIERGNHEDLLEKQGVYWDLYNGSFELE